jgi:hypothetical protein
LSDDLPEHVAERVVAVEVRIGLGRASLGVEEPRRAGSEQDRAHATVPDDFRAETLRMAQRLQSCGVDGGDVRVVSVWREGLADHAGHQQVVAESRFSHDEQPRHSAVLGAGLHLGFGLVDDCRLPFALGAVPDDASQVEGVKV